MTRVNDYIEIINPKFVKRVGYNIHPADMYEDIKQDKDIIEALKTIGIHPEIETVGIFKTDIIVPDKLVKAIAYVKTSQANFGGNERRIHYLDGDYNHLKGTIFRVLGRKTAKTGTRVPASGSYDIDGKYIYESGFLDEEKTHVMYNIMHNMTDYWIEKCNVRKVNLG